MLYWIVRSERVLLTCDSQVSCMLRGVLRLVRPAMPCFLASQAECSDPEPGSAAVVQHSVYDDFVMQCRMFDQSQSIDIRGRTASLRVGR